MTGSIDAAALHGRRMRWQELRAAVSDSSAPPLRVAVLASYTIDPLVPYLGLGLLDAGWPALPSVGPFDQIVQACVAPDGAVTRMAPDVLVVAPRVVDLRREGQLRFRDAEAHLRAVCDNAYRAADRTNAHLVVIRPAAADLPPHVRGMFTEALDRFEAQLSGLPAVDVVAFDDIIESLGESDAYHAALFAHARIPYREPVFAQLADRLTGVLTAPPPASVSAVLVDVGVVLDAVGPADSGPVLAVLEPLRRFVAAGGRIFVRGDVSEVAKRPGLLEVVGQIDDVTHSWLPATEPAAHQLAHLADGLHCGQNGVVLLTVEGNPVPDRSWCLPADSSRWPAIAAELLADLARDDDGVGDIAEVLASNTDLASYLRTLDVLVEAEPLEVADAAAFADLVRRNVDFGLGIVPAGPELAAAVADPRQAAWGVGVRDRTGDYGRSGVVHLAADGDSCTVRAFSLSCVVLGRGVESAVLDEIRRWATEHGCRRIAVNLVRTPRNEQAVAFLAAESATNPPNQPPLSIREITE